MKWLIAWNILITIIAVYALLEAENVLNISNKNADVLNTMLEDYTTVINQHRDTLNNHKSIIDEHKTVINANSASLNSTIESVEQQRQVLIDIIDYLNLKREVTP